MKTSEHQWHLSVLTLTALCILLDLVILLTLIGKFYFNCCTQNIEENETKFEFNKKWTLVFIFAVILTAISDFLHLYYGNIDNDESIYGNQYRYIITIADAFYFFYTIQLYTFLIYRVYSIFKNTEYNISQFTMIVFLILFIINFCLMMYYLIVAVQMEYNIVDGDTFNPLLWIPLICSDICINAAIMTVMIKKLRKLVVITSMPDNCGINNDYGEPLIINIDHHGKTYVDIMSKFSVLSAIIVIFNQIFGTWLLCTVLMGESDSFSDSCINIIQFIGYGMRDVEGFIDCFVVYLTFKMNENMYNKWCCCCHNVLQKLFMTNIQKKIKIKNRNAAISIQES